MVHLYIYGYLTIDCRLSVHHHCLDAITLPCLSAANFSADRIRAAFLRCFASLLFNYRKHLEPLPPQTQNSGSEAQIFNFKLAGFLRAASRDSAAYLEMLSETQAFNEFIMERCIKAPDDPEIALFDQIILAKRNRGRHGLFGKQGKFGYYPPS
jgi:dDENN domain